MAVDSLKITALDVRLAVFQFPATIWGVNTLLYKVSISIVSSSYGNDFSSEISAR